MTDLVHAFAIGTFGPTLGSLSNLLDKGAQHAVIQRWDATRLPDARLAPDMFNLTQQVRLACLHAKDNVGLLTGLAAPQFEDNETTIEDLKSRIAATIAFLDGVPASAFDGAAERRVRMPLREGLVLEASGLEFLRDWALPHFYFHVVTAYDILRHQGVEIGKADYLRHVGYAIKPAG
jgi:hypothetical protein